MSIIPSSIGSKMPWSRSSTLSESKAKIQLATEDDYQHLLNVLNGHSDAKLLSVHEMQVRAWL
jgi:hypothetical protein